MVLKVFDRVLQDFILPTESELFTVDYRSKSLLLETQPRANRFLNILHSGFSLPSGADVYVGDILEVRVKESIVDAPIEPISTYIPDLSGSLSVYFIVVSIANSVRIKPLTLDVPNTLDASELLDTWVVGEFITDEVIQGAIISGSLYRDYFNLHKPLEFLEFLSAFDSVLTSELLDLLFFKELAILAITKIYGFGNITLKGRELLVTSDHINAKLHSIFLDLTNNFLAVTDSGFSLPLDFLTLDGLASASLISHYRSELYNILLSE